MADIHSFSVDVAMEVGVNAAVLLQSIKFWCAKNRANGKNEHDGLYWTYNSVKAWQELYPYLGKSAIDSALKRLEDRGFIKVGNYNKSAYDRTKWYAITDDGLGLFGESISENREMDETKSGNGFGENSQPIPVTEQLQSQDAEEDIPFSEIVGYLNEKAGTHYRASTSKTKERIRARWREGFRLDDFKRVIDVKCAEWLGTEFEKYLCPDTLFGTKFEKYANQPMTRSRAKEGRGRNDAYDFDRKADSSTVTHQHDAYDWSGYDDVRF